MTGPVSREPIALQLSKISQVRSAPVTTGAEITSRVLRTVGGVTVPLVIAQKGLFGRVSYRISFPDGFTFANRQMAWADVVHLPSGRVIENGATLIIDGRARASIPTVSQDPKKPSPLLKRGVVAGTLYVSSDITGTLVNTIFFVSSLASNPGLTAALKYSSLAVVFTGAITMYSACRNLRRALAIGDVAGKVIEIIRLIRGGFEIATGLVAGAFRTITLIAAAPGTAAKTVVVSALPLGISLTAVASILYVLIALPFAIMAVKGIRLIRETGRPVEEAFAALQKRVTLQNEDFIRAEKSISFRNEAELKALCAEDILLTSEERNILSERDRTRIREIVNRLHSARENEVKNHLIKRMEKACAQRKLSKHADYLRAAGGGSLEQLKICEVAANGQISLEKMQDVVKIARKEAIKAVITYTLIILTAIIGITSFVLTTVFSGGLALVIGLGLMLAMNILWLALDSQGLKAKLEALKTSKTLDKVIMSIFLAITVLSIAAGAFFSGGLLPLILILIFGAISVAFQGSMLGYSIYKTREVVKTPRDAPPCNPHPPHFFTPSGDRA